MNLIENHYSNYDEEARLGYRHGQVEFITTMKYLEKYLHPGAYVLEVGAGTGRYSCAIADLGHRVEAVELVPHNIEIFKGKITPAQDIRVSQGNALDLNVFDCDMFDITLVLGPMYHLYTALDKEQAIREALRVTKPGGIVFVAYIIGDAAILEDVFMRNRWDISEELTGGKIDPRTFEVRSAVADIFALVRKDDIDRLMASFDVEPLHYVGTDMISRILRESLASMDEEKFELYLQHHFAICERPDMVGLTSHSLDIFRKPLESPLFPHKERNHG